MRMQCLHRYSLIKERFYLKRKLFYKFTITSCLLLLQLHKLKKEAGVLPLITRTVPTKPRKIIVLRHAERVDVTFGEQWLQYSFDSKGETLLTDNKDLNTALHHYQVSKQLTVVGNTHVNDCHLAQYLTHFVQNRNLLRMCAISLLHSNRSVLILFSWWTFLFLSPFLPCLTSNFHFSENEVKAVVIM